MILMPPESFVIFVWIAAFSMLRVQNFSSSGLLSTLEITFAIVAKQVFATPGCLSSVYRDSTILTPSYTLSNPYSFFYLTSSSSSSLTCPPLALLSAFNLASISFLAFACSSFSLFCSLIIY